MELNLIRVGLNSVTCVHLKWILFDLQGIVAYNEDRLGSRERFVMKYMEAASKFTEEDHLQYITDTGQYNTLVSLRLNLINTTDIMVEISMTSYLRGNRPIKHI